MDSAFDKTVTRPRYPPRLLLEGLYQKAVAGPGAAAPGAVGPGAAGSDTAACVGLQHSEAQDVYLLLPPLVESLRHLQ